MSFVKVRDYCQGAVLDGASDARTKSFSKLRDGGKWQNNVQRDLVHKLSKPLGMPEVVIVKVPLFA